MDLKAEAAAEVRRLLDARALDREGDAAALADLDADGPWIATARRHPIRAALGRRVLLIWRVAYEDGSGAIIESRLVPVAIEHRLAGGRRGRSASVQTLVRSQEEALRAQVDAAATDWSSRVERVVELFTSTQQARARAVASRGVAVAASTFQPGLFDRRTEHARADRAAAKADADRAVAERAAAIAQSRSIRRRPAELLLVLVP